MPPQKKKEPAPGPSWETLTSESIWELTDLEYIRESLEAVETALQSFATVVYLDVVLRIDDKVVAAHHDGTKWWVKFGG